jgi:hypothetical protein
MRSISTRNIAVAQSPAQSGNSPFWCGAPYKINSQKKIALAREKQKNTQKAQKHPQKAQKHPQKAQKHPKKAKKTPKNFFSRLRAKINCPLPKINCFCWCPQTTSNAGNSRSAPQSLSLRLLAICLA